MDTVTPSTRSRMMASIHGKDTRPELLIRKALFARGFRFRVNCKDLPGRPDLKLTKHGAVILVHGCFWHGHNCRYFRLPSSNVGFWEDKIRKNRERDLRDVQALRVAGWRVCIVWECATRLVSPGTAVSGLASRISRWIEGRSTFVEFFDAAAMDGRSRPSVRSAKSQVGTNGTMTGFAAERSPPYGATVANHASP